MKLNNGIEIKEFQKAIESCKGNVYLKSPYGDCLNLKSLLSMYVGIGQLLSEHGDELEIFCENADEGHFFEFFNNHPDVLN